MPTLSPAARAIFQKANLDLSAKDAAKIDNNGDATIDAAEAKALVRVIDRDDNGTIDDKEQKALDHFVGKDPSLGAAEAWLDNNGGFNPESGVQREIGASQRQKRTAESELSTAKHEKFMAESDAKREMGYTTPEPTASADALKAEYKETGTSADNKREIADRSSAIATDKAELLALKEETPKLERRLGSLERKGLDEDLSKAEGRLAKYERLFAKMPTRKARDGHVADLNAQRDDVKDQIKDLKKVRPRTQQVKDQIEGLEDQSKSLYAERREAEQFYPPSAEKKIKSYTKKVAGLQEDIATRDGLRDQVAGNTARAAELGKNIADNTEGLGKAEKNLERSTLLEKQIPFAEVRDAHAAKVTAAEAKVTQAEGRIDALKQESTNVKDLMAQAESVTAGARSTVGTKRSIERLTKSLQAEQKRAAESPYLREQAEKLAKAQAIKNLVNKGELDADDVNMAKLDGDIAGAKKALNNAAQRIEEKADALSEALEDPKNQENLSKMTEGERASFEGAAHEALAPTEAGKKFYEKNIKPVIDGSPKASNFWKDAFSTVNKAQGTPLKFIESYGRYIAAEGGTKALKTLDKAMAQSLGLNPREMVKVRKALDMVSDDGKGVQDAQEFLKSQGGRLADVADKLDKVGNTFGAVSGVIAVAELIKDPSLKKSLEVASNAGDMATVANLIKKNKALTNFSKVAGKFAPPLNAVLGTWNAIDAHERGDTGAAVGNGMQGLGGAMALVGAGMSATGIGAAAGVPLAIAGGIVSGIGTVVDWVFGDNKTEAFLREHAPEYMD